MKMVLTFVNDPPAKSVDMLVTKLSASILVPGIMGWLFQTNSFLHPECVHIAFMVMALPVWVAVIVGLLPLQKWQNWKSSRSLDKNNMYLGSVLTSRRWQLFDIGILQ